MQEMLFFARMSVQNASQDGALELLRSHYKLFFNLNSDEILSIWYRTTLILISLN